MSEKKSNKIKMQFKQFLEQYKHTELPAGLSSLRFNRMLAAIVIVLASILAAVATRNVGFLIMLVVAAALVLMALKIKYDYIKGYIHEYDLVCVSNSPVKRGLETVGMDVVFIDENNNTTVLTSNSRKKIFYEDVRYKVYVSEMNKKVIVGYSQV